MMDFQKLFIQKIINSNKLAHQGNNELWKIQTQKREYLLKIYSEYHSDNWKRGENEYNSIRYLRRRGIKEIPEAIKFYEKENIGIYSFVEGRTLKQEEISDKHIISAADFLAKVHKLRTRINKFGPASSACFSKDDYFNVINRRFENVSNFKADTGILREAKELLENKISPRIKKINEDMAKLPIDYLKLESQVLTPADFGFHNILVNGEDYKFVDFEYFGRDDPARQIMDFLHHDKFKEVKKELGYLFLKEYQEKVGKSIEPRIKIIDPIIGLTWVLIYLNVLPQVARDNLYKKGLNVDNILKERIKKAENKLEDINYFR